MICPLCYRSLLSISCPWCALRPPLFSETRRHLVGADTSATVPAASPYQAASWGDLQLLYPPLWIPWITGKIVDSAFDPSQQTDPAEKRKMLAAVAKQLDTVIGTNSSVPQSDRDGWQTFAQAFIPWFNKDVGMLDAGADAEQGNAFQDQLHDWQVEISKYANIGMPILPRSAPTLSQLAQQGLGTAEKYFDTVKVVFLVGLAGLVLIFFVAGKDNLRKLAGKVVTRMP